MPRDENGADSGFGDECDGYRRYCLTDANMNVTCLVEGTAGAADLGAAVERYVYGPCGRVTGRQR